MFSLLTYIFINPYYFQNLSLLNYDGSLCVVEKYTYIAVKLAAAVESKVYVPVVVPWPVVESAVPPPDAAVLKEWNV